jgi:hypothetical protein
MTLVEVMTTLGLSTMVFSAVTSSSLFSGRSMAALANYADLDARSRSTLDLMSREIRQARKLTAATERSLSFQDRDGHALAYQYNPEAKTLTCTQDGRATTLLTGCTFLKFNTYQRTPVGGSFEQFPPGTVDQVKVVQMNWVCERHVMGLANTESVQSAKVVLRNQ